MKIFGIGLPKTGNHSLAAAMEILGYSAKRFPESDAEIDKYDFTCDNPIIVQYQNLDKKYPGSKFIMMTRDDESWLVSSRNHMNRKTSGKLSPLRKEMMLRRYGTLAPTDSQKLTEKHRYESEVAEYFKDRSNDFLIINIVAGEGWEKLCPFLGVTLPKHKFPKENVTTKIHKR